MPPGECPQLAVRLDGPHRAGLIKDTAAAVAQRGASIAALQKIALGRDFSCLMHVWEPTPAREALAAALAEAVGPSVKCVVKDLDPGSRDLYKLGQTPLPERRMTITCRQRPGLIFAVTELLTAQGCTIPKLETKTYIENNVTTFFMDALVVLHDPNNADAIAQELQLISDANDGLRITFDQSDVHRINVLEHA